MVQGMAAAACVRSLSAAEMRPSANAITPRVQVRSGPGVRASTLSFAAVAARSSRARVRRPADA